MLRLAVLARHYLWRRAVGYDAPFAYDDVVVEDHSGPGAVVDAVWVIARTGALPDDTRARVRDFAASRESIPRVRQSTNQMYAECLLAVGEADAAFDALTVAVDCGFADIAWAERCPLLDPWRADPRWVPLLGRIVARGRIVLDVWRATPEAQALVSVSRSLRAAS